MRNYRIIVAYDGSAYRGWQKQREGLTIQGLLEESASTLLRTPVSIVGSGRTDAGVHAINQVANFFHPSLIDSRRFLYSMNSLLPAAIRVRALDEVPLDFHARYSVISKEYHYYLHINPTMDPFKRNYALHIPQPFFDLGLIPEAASLFLGTHDFSSFINNSHSCLNPVRTLMRIDLVEQTEGVRIEFEGDGFLYKMVRNIVATLIEVAKHKITIQQIEEIFLLKDRRRVPTVAPAHALFLADVYYPAIYHLPLRKR